MLSRKKTHAMKLSLLKIFLVIVTSAILIALCIRWGIPSTDHPFTYQMDEWHQLMAVRSLLKTGTSNVEGAANGPLGAFLLAVGWLSPWAAVHLSELSQLGSPLEHLELQHNLFIWLRIETLAASIATLCLAVYFMKRASAHLVKGWWYIGFWAFAPLWLVLSNYFKYDIVLTFFLMLAGLSVLSFSRKPTLKHMCLTAGLIGCAVAIKVSALPLTIPLAYLLVTKIPKQKILLFALYGLASFLLTVGLFGFPDLLFLGRGEYLSFFYDNIVAVPSYSQQYLTGHSQFVYLLGIQFPYQFGYGFVAFLLICGATLLHAYALKKEQRTPVTQDEVLIIITLLACVVSLVPLQLMMVGNRWLVLLPWLFMAGYQLWLRVIRTQLYKNNIKIYRTIVMLCLLIQLLHGVALLSTRIEKDPRKISTELLLQQNIPTVLGMENIPIYQMIPDVLLYEQYRQQYDKNYTSSFSFAVIDHTTPVLPDDLIITNVLMGSLVPTTAHAQLIQRLSREGYQIKWQVRPQFSFHRYFGTEEMFALSGLNALPTDITHYSRHN